MKTKATAVSGVVVLLVLTGVASYSSCSSSSNIVAVDAGHGGSGGGAGAGGGAGGGAGAGGTGNCGGNFAPTDAGPPDAATFRVAVQALMDAHCTGCHGAADAAATLNLTNVATVVGQISTQCGPADGGADAHDAGVAVTGKMIVDPNHPEVSYIVDKVIGHAQNCGCFVGARQPEMCNVPDAGRACLSTDDIQTIVNWIATGAQ